MKENGLKMNNNEVFNFVEDWLERKRIKSYFSSKKKGHKKYIKMQEEDFYELCFKLVELIKYNVE